MFCPGLQGIGWLRIALSQAVTDSHAPYFWKRPPSCSQTVLCQWALGSLSSWHIKCIIIGGQKGGGSCPEETAWSEARRPPRWDKEKKVVYFYRMGSKYFRLLSVPDCPVVTEPCSTMASQSCLVSSVHIHSKVSQGQRLKGLWGCS